MIARRAASRLVAVLAALVVAGSLAGPALATSAPVPRLAGGTLFGASGACAAEWQAFIAKPSLATLKAAGACEIARRLADLDALRAKVAASTHLSADEKAKLTELIDAAEAALRELRTALANDTTILTLKADVLRIFGDVRVYALVVRQVWLATGDALVGDAADGLDAAADKIATAIATASGAGKDTSSARSHLDAMRAAIAAARAEVAGDAGAVLALTAVQWNDGTAAPVLKAARESLRAAKADLATALAEGKAAVDALK